MVIETCRASLPAQYQLDTQRSLWAHGVLDQHLDDLKASRHVTTTPCLYRTQRNKEDKGVLRTNSLKNNRDGWAGDNRNGKFVFLFNPENYFLKEKP